ncbi:MAG: trigger factor [Candidatus Magasanikbacteria bacterium CG10_big_fil_rev_8_21_14_0_10_47_10]|uniref:Trigger factor n=1 Tax=Candidatus Magasanikbacteria bacterium CG10_big_fil_rev_8_21_14_0_10_47_10 TaxID=1974652 RepID=A0A2H0TPQ8_9BACT|nr:MAG: trigger factor [Candidatus Magasanikbacteria bacterium CG10_big_fil_rev_8_21_14_0_10_47_10]
MPHTLKTLEKSQVELSISVPSDDFTPHLEKAATRLSGRMAIKGFRKGHVPYDTIKKEVGEMAILQEALESIVQESYVNTIKEEKLEVIGMPSISIEKAAPGNDLSYTATVALLPDVTLPDISQITIEKKEAAVDAEKLRETIDALRGMHATEKVKSGPAEKKDKLVLDMEMLMDAVPVEGGHAKDYQVYLSEDHYIPGFNEQVIGLKKGEKKEFSLDFPKNHYQKNLAGKKVTAKVKVTDVFERTLPELDDEFAKKLGLESTKKLEELVQSNLLAEAKQKAEQKAEIELLETLIEKSSFSDLPDVLIDSERQKIFYELKNDIEKHGLTIDQYLQDIKKTEQELFDGFTKQATERAKAALISRQVAKENNITVTSDDIDAEVDLIRGAYENDKDALENLKRPEVRDSIATMLQNKKVMVFLKDQVFGEKKADEDKKEELPE